MTLITDSIVYLIIGVVSLIVVGIFVATLFGSSFVDDAPCSATSTLTSIQRSVAGITVFAPPPSDSDRNEICPPSVVKLSERTSDEATIKTIAQQMAVCHRDYGAGDLDLFSHERNEKTLYCVVCSYIDFPDGASGELEGLSDYLVTVKVPGKDFTYAEYVGSLDHELYESAFVPEYTIDTASDYGILYFYGEKSAFWANHIEASAMLAGTGAGVGVVGAVVVLATLPVSGTAAAVVALSSLVIVPVSGLVGAGIGTAAGATVETGSEYVGATVLIPWDSDVFANALKCERIEGLV